MNRDLVRRVAVILAVAFACLALPAAAEDAAAERRIQEEVRAFSLPLPMFRLRRPSRLRRAVYAVGNVVLTVLGPIIVACTFVG